MTSTTTFHLVRQGTAAKLGANSTGTISYAVLIDADRTEPFIALTGNDGGGYFSREAVPISALRRCARQTDTDKPLGASAFKPAFVGRSTNNGYFAVAALCAEGLLSRVQRDGRAGASRWPMSASGTTGAPRCAPRPPRRAMACLCSRSESRRQPSPRLTAPLRRLPPLAKVWRRHQVGGFRRGR